MPRVRCSRCDRRLPRATLARQRRRSEAEALRGGDRAWRRRGIGTLIATAADGEAPTILEFQLAMLEDEALTEPGLRGDRRRHSRRRRPGVEALDAEIVGYEASDDDYFRARAADLERHPRPGAARADRGRRRSRAPPGAILFGDDITPTRFLETDWSHGGGIALTAGSTASHVAMLARSRGVPMVVGLGASADRARRHGAARRRARRHRAAARPRPRSSASAKRRIAFAARRGQRRRLPGARRR